MAFTATNIIDTILTADKIWMDNTSKADYVAHVGVATALLQEQTAMIGQSFTEGKTDKVKLTWVNACFTDVVTCTDDCNFSGEELATDSKTYEITSCFEKGFKVNEMIERTNTVTATELAAKGILQACKLLDEKIAKVAIAVIEANEGTNAYTGLGTIVGTETTVAAANFNVSMMPHLNLAGIMNRFVNPFILSGSNLYLVDWVAQNNKANGEGKGDAAQIDSIRRYYDLFNIDTVNTPNFKTYLIDKGTLALATRNYYGAKPTEYMGANQQIRYSVESRNLSGVRYDVHVTQTCTAGTFFTEYKVKARFDWFTNPIGCEAGRTGILTYKKV